MKKNAFAWLRLILITLFIVRPGKPAYAFNETTFTITDSTWSVKPIIKIGDPAPGTSGFISGIHRYYVHQAGGLLFWVQVEMTRKLKFNALYSYKGGSLKPVFIETNEAGPPGWIPEGVTYSQLIGPTYIHGNDQMFYITQVLNTTYKKGFNIYGWDGSQVKKILSKGDEVKLTDGRSLSIDLAHVIMTTKNHAIIGYSSSRPNKVEGWLLHDGFSLKPLIQQDESLPGTSVNKVKLIGWNPYVSNDTILMMVQDNAPGLPAFSKDNWSFVRLTNEKAETVFSETDPHPLTEGKFLKNLVVFNIQSPRKFLVKSDRSLLLFNNGRWKTIINDLKDIPENRGFEKFFVDGSLFIGKQDDSILFSISLINDADTYPNTGVITGRLPLLLLYDGNTLKNIPWYEQVTTTNLLDGLKAKTNPLNPITLTKIPGFEEILVKIPWFEIEDNKKMLPNDFSLGRYLYNPVDRDARLRKVTPLKTEPNIPLTLGCFAGWIDERRMLVKTGATEAVLGFYEVQIN